MYGPAQMDSKARDVFYQWYNEHSDDPFEFQSELERYCRLDVDILAQGWKLIIISGRILFSGCMRFRDILLHEHEVDPFLSAITIASTCMYIFRKR